MTILLTVLAFAGLIIFHELGHYALARWCGMRVERFSVGFGPVLARKQVGETEWAVSALPLGGYVKIAGMDPTEQHDDPRAYINRPPWQRLLVIGAGPAANYVLAAILFAVVLMMGPMVVDTSKAQIGQTIPGTPAAEAGLDQGDRVLAVDGDPIPDWPSFQSAIQQRPGKETALTVERDKETLELLIVPNAAEFEGRTIGQVGVVPSSKRSEGLPFGRSVVGGFVHTWDWNVRIIQALRNLFAPEVELQGPVGIIRETNRAAEEGIVPFLLLVAVISVHLALFNLLPIPALDGGRLVFLFAEAARRKPINARIELTVHAVGFILLLSLILVVTFRDVGRIWGG